MLQRIIKCQNFQNRVLGSNWCTHPTFSCVSAVRENSKVDKTFYTGIAPNRFLTQTISRAYPVLRCLDKRASLALVPLMNHTQRRLFAVFGLCKEHSGYSTICTHLATLLYFARSACLQEGKRGNTSTSTGTAPYWRTLSETMYHNS